MALFKCKMCGGALEVSEGTTIIECGYCGTQQTLPKLNDERRANMYDRANHFRRNNEFDKAMGIYEQILNEDNSDAEAYWSLVLCRYGIEYVEDPSSHRRIPTVNRAQFTSIFDDDNYKSALKYSDITQRSIYETEAREINEIQKGILAISQKEEPFDVFICYKETDNGQRTHDSVLAQDLYYGLKNEGFKVFFARITLESKLGSAYEPYIFAALNSAKVMVVLGTKPEYFNAVWVKNEWSRYLSLIKQGKKKMLIPAYKDMDPYNLPQEFSHLQAQDMSKLGFMQDLIRGIKKIVKGNEPKATVVKETVVTTGNTNIEPLLKRAFMFLEDGDYESADEYAEKVLDINPECSDAYIVKLLIDLDLKSSSEISSYSEPIDEEPNYIKALRFAQGDERTKIEDYNKAIVERIEHERKSAIYSKGCQYINSRQFSEAVSVLSSILDFKDASQKVEYCKEQIELNRKQNIYATAIKQVASSSADDMAIKSSIRMFKDISGFKDADAQAEKLEARLEKWYEDKKIADEKARIKAEQEKMEKARLEELRKLKEAERQRKAKRLAKKLLIVAIVLVVLLVLITQVVIPLYKMDKADNLYEQGEYEEAYKIYSELNGFGKSERKSKVTESINLLRNKKYDDAVKTLLENNVPVEIQYRFNGATSHTKDSETVLLNDASTFTGIIQPTKNGYDLEWNLDEFSYDLNGKDGSFAIKLSAVWKQAEYDIKYNLDGGKTTGNNPTKYNFYTDSFTLINPTKVGYTFVGWTGTDISKPTTEITINKGSYGDREYKAIWEANSVKITLDANGGSCDKESITVKYNDTLSLPTPTWDGHTFMGWYNGDNKVYASDACRFKEDVELTAKWDAITYSITYVLNNGTNSSSNPSYYTADEEIVLQEPTRTKYEFIGWTYDGQETPVKNLTIAVGTTGDKVYEANWKFVGNKITFDSNGGVAVDAIECLSYGDKYTLPTPTRTGYTFNGWYNGSSKVSSGTGYWYGSSDMSLKASWTANKYTIRLDANGGSVSSSYQYITYDSTYTLPTPTRTGYTFDGWYNGETKVASSGTSSFASNITLKAKWAASTYTITLDANGGTGVDSKQTVTYGTTYILPTPTRTGYTFNGWYDGSSKVSSGTWNRTSDLSLKASWTAINYKVTFDANGGTCSLSYGTIDYGLTYTLPTPTRTGYTFDGWYNGETKVPDTGTWNYASNLTLKAKWTISTYTITLDANGGTGVDSKLTVTYGATYTLPTPQRTGYTFNGWYDGSTRVYNGTWQRTSNLSLKASWTANTYTVTYEDTTEILADITVTFDYNYGGSTPSKVTLTNRQTLTYPDLPFRGGYVFVGWYTNSSCTTKYEFTGTITTDMTLYAGWKEMSLTNVETEYQIDPTYCTSSSNDYYLFLFGTSSTKKEHVYLVAEETGQHHIFYGTNFSNFTYYLQIYNLTTNTYILSNTSYSTNGYYQKSFNCKKGDIIVISAYHNLGPGDHKGVSLYFDGFGSPTSTATATLPKTGECEYKNDSTYIDSVVYDTNYTLPTPTREGYTFLGWYNGDTKVESGIWTTPSDVKLTPKWREE